ncbi:MAG: hypothetical protein ABEI74_01205 [Candidatus Pacearchaeota archaeon]
MELVVFCFILQLLQIDLLIKTFKKNNKSNVKTTSIIRTNDWVKFSTEEIKGVSYNFSLRHPPSWIQRGSIDGGGVSAIPFCKKNEYFKNYKETLGKDPGRCIQKEVAKTLVIKSFMSSSEKNYKNKKVKEIKIDGYQGKKISGMIKESGQKIIKVTLSDSDNDHFEFKMMVNNKKDKLIFNQILETLEINNF